MDATLQVILGGGHAAVASISPMLADDAPVLPGKQALFEVK